MEKQTTRLEAFSDGIFSVAITLLAIEIGIKEYEGATNLNLWHRIVGKWPEYFTYFNSFATLLLMWMGHHQIFMRLREANHWVMLLNGLMLMFVVLFPYPTKLVGEFIGSGGEQTAICFYAGFIGCISLSMLLLNFCIYNNKKLLLNPKKNADWLKKRMLEQIIGIAIYAGIAVLAFYTPKIALISTFVMWAFWIFGVMDKKQDNVR